MRKLIFVFLVICALWDLQRIPGKAAQTTLHTVNGVITSVKDNSVYWVTNDGDIYYFYGVGYNPGETITNVLDANGAHVFIDVKGV